MAFWNNASVEPKRTHRFLVQFTLPDGSSSQIYARTATKPAFEIGQTEHKFLGQTYYYPGSISWSDVTISFVDSLSPDMDDQLTAILIGSGWVDPNAISTTENVDQGGTINKFDATNAVGEVLLKDLDGDGTTVGTYRLNNAWVKSISYSTLDYASEDLLTVDVVFRYDWANYYRGEQQVGGV
jgi:hypothetical protein